LKKKTEAHLDKKTVEKTGVKTVEETVEETVEKTGEKILSLIRLNPHITAKELTIKIGLSRRGIEWQIAKLKKEGKLNRIGSAKGGHWEVKR